MMDSTQVYQLTVNLSSDTGEVKHGASGFLYGLGNDGIPSLNMLIPLKPQVVAQKPEGGWQHPNGDAINVSEMYKAAGGREIQIYMQDTYPRWTYDDLGLSDYLNKVDSIVSRVVASPNRDMFSYVPFNEPDWIWYNPDSKKQTFFNDWKTVFDRIKSLDPSARIVGPGFSVYNSAFFRDFLVFCRDNNCLPDVISWHELLDDFFTDWYNHYDNYRNNESSVGISPREVVINEYGRSSGDLGIPGQLMQWMARLEDSKADGCLGYWTNAGSLNDLVTRDNYNKATGGWWLYKWYGDMTGHTITVTPPNANAEGLQGLASLDSSKKQARILFGGSGGTTNVVVQGFNAASYFGSSVHVTVWETASTGLNASGGPTFKQEGDYTISNGQISVPVGNMNSSSAYLMIITPDIDSSSANNANRYETKYSGTSDAGTNFVVTADDNAFYNIRLRYSAGPLGSAPTGRTTRMMLNGEILTDLSLPGTADWNMWADVNVNVFLTAGINRIAFNTHTSDDSDAINIDYIEITPGSGSADSYEAEASSNTLSGAANAESNSAASGGQFVSHIGRGSNNYLQFNNVNVPSSGTYRMVVQFANFEHAGEEFSTHHIVDRYANISVNGGGSQKVRFRNTFDWNNFQTRVVDVYLNAGNNTIRFSNCETYAPHIDKIEIAQMLTIESRCSNREPLIIC